MLCLDMCAMDVPGITHCGSQEVPPTAASVAVLWSGGGGVDPPAALPNHLPSRHNAERSLSQHLI